MMLFLKILIGLVVYAAAACLVGRRLRSIRVGLAGAVPGKPAHISPEYLPFVFGDYSRETRNVQTVSRPLPNSNLLRAVGSVAIEPVEKPAAPRHGDLPVYIGEGILPLMLR